MNHTPGRWSVTSHTSHAIALIRETATVDRSLTERELRDIQATRTCRFLAKHTGLSFEEVVEIYEQEQSRMNRETQRTWENVAHYGTVVYRDHDSVLYSTRQNACRVPLTVALHYLVYNVRIRYTRGPR